MSSGLLQSEQLHPEGSLIADIPLVVKAFLIKLLIAFRCDFELILQAYHGDQIHLLNFYIDKHGDDKYVIQDAKNAKRFLY